jgi:hypothetical protein
LNATFLLILGTIIMSIEQQPEAWIVINKETGYRIQVSYFPDLYNKDMFELIPLYTHPKPEPLSHEQYMKFFTDTYNSVNPITDFVRAIEKAHGIGGGE